MQGLGLLIFETFLLSSLRSQPREISPHMEHLAKSGDIRLSLPQVGERQLVTGIRDQGCC